MIKEYAKKTNIGVGFGIIAQIIGFYLSYYAHIGIILWTAAILIWGGILLMMWGLWNYSKGKGYHGAWGLLGLLSIPGLIILALFPDRKKEKK